MQINELPATTNAPRDAVVPVDVSSVTKKVETDNFSAGYLFDHGDTAPDETWVEAKFRGSYLDETANTETIYMAGMQRKAPNSSIASIGTVTKDWVKEYLGIPTGTPTVASRFAAITQVTSQVVNQPDLTIGNNGWVQLTIPASGTPLFAIATTWTIMTSPFSALAIVGTGSNWYLTGNPGVTVKGLKVRYFFIG